MDEKVIKCRFRIKQYVKGFIVEKRIHFFFFNIWIPFSIYNRSYKKMYFAFVNNALRNEIDELNKRHAPD